MPITDQISGSKPSTEPAPKAPRLSRARVWLRAAAGIALVALLFYIADLARFVELIRSAEIWPLLIGSGAFFFVPLAESRRLQLGFEQFHLSFRAALDLFLIGTYFSAFASSIAASEAYKLYYFMREKIPLAQSVSLLIFIRAVNILTLVMFAIVYVLVEPEFVPALAEAIRQASALRVTGFEIALVTGTLFITVISVLFIAGRWTPLFQRLNGLSEQFRQTFSLIKPRQIGGIAFYTLATVAARGYGTVQFVEAFGGEISVPYVIILLSIATFVSLIPITVASLGVREGILMIGMLPFGVTAEVGLAAAILGRLFNILYAAVGAFLFAVQKPTSAK